MSAVPRALVAVVLVAACGGKGPPVAPPIAPPVAAAPAPVAAPGPAPIPVAPVTCADAGVLLARTFAAYDDAMVAKHEGEIAKACTAGHWPQAVLDCIGGSSSETSGCVEKLPHEQQVALVSSVTQAEPPKSAAPEPDEDAKFTPCEMAVAKPEIFGGPPTGTPDDVAFTLALRGHRLVDACNEDNWPERAKECFASATDADKVGVCVTRLQDHAQTGAVSAVVGAEELAAKTFELRKSAPKIACPKVVAKHYSDAAWKDRLAKLAPAAKKTAIAASRTRMTKACTADKWSPTQRACVLAGGDFPECSMRASGVDPWGFPAFGVVIPTGVPACDKYIAGIAKLAECPGAKDVRDALYATVSSAETTIADMSEDTRKVIGEACEGGMAQLPEQAKAYGCTP